MPPLNTLPTTRRPHLTLKALVAVEHAIISAIVQMLTTGTGYRDLGSDYHQRHDPATRQQIASYQL
jgi:hypothetical protein